jgi:hypothetical protein
VARRRGQATVELVGIALVLALLLAGLGVAAVRSGAATAVVGAVARVLGGSEGGASGTPAPQLQAATLAQALAAARSDPDAFSLAGARALLAEEVGPALAERVLAGLVEAEARRRAPTWFAAQDRRLDGGLLGDVRVRSSGAGPVSLHVVTPHEEAVAGAPGPRGGWAAALRAVTLDGLTEVASRIHVVAGVSLDVATFLAGAVSDGDDGKAVVRAGDVVLCRPYEVRVELGGDAERIAFTGTRLLVLRGPAVVAESAVHDGTCG